MALDLAYDKAMDGVPGVPGLESAEGLAEDYLNDPGFQVLKAATSGFVTGLGGVLTLPVATPEQTPEILWIG